MANPTISNNDVSQLEVFSPEYDQDMVDFGTAETRPVGQILGRKILATAVTSTPDGGNTGDGVVDNQALSAQDAPAKVGDYLLTCVEAITNSGRFKLEDPDGKLLDDQIVVTVSGTTVFQGHGLRFDIADGAADWAVADFITLATTADGALDSYDPAEFDGREIPVALMARARTEAAAANYPEMVLIKGEVRRAIVETAQGATVSKVLKDQLADLGIVLREQDQMAELDNA